MAIPGSVTRLIEQLRSSDPRVRGEAARQIWLRYSSDLLDLARHSLSRHIRRREDEEDVLQNVYKSLYLRMQNGQYQLNNRGDLWRLLVEMTLNKTKKTARRNKAKRRDIDREDYSSAADAADSLGPNWLLESMESSDPTPDIAAILNEQFQTRLAALPPSLKQIALWKMEGHTNAEIGGKLDCAERTVERKLEKIRAIWES